MDSGTDVLETGQLQRERVFTDRRVPTEGNRLLDRTGTERHQLE
jgi:hypothetical protein